MIVTISREYGAGALDVASELAALTGYRLVGEELPRIAATLLGASEEEVAALEGRSPSLAERIIAHLGTASPETLATIAPQADEFEKEVRVAIEAAVRQVAASGDAIIVGRIANMILRDRADLLRVFLHAPVAFRAARVEVSLGVGRAEALGEIARIDAARRRWAKIHYGMEWGAARYYDVTIDVGRFGVSGAAAIIAKAVNEADS